MSRNTVGTPVFYIGYDISPTIGVVSTSAFDFMQFEEE